MPKTSTATVAVVKDSHPFRAIHVDRSSHVEPFLSISRGSQRSHGAVNARTKIAARIQKRRRKMTAEVFADCVIDSKISCAGKGSIA
jgi:hypothetical protein